MKRLFAPTVFVSLTLIALGSETNAAPPARGTSTHRATSTGYYYKPTTTISTTNRVITTVGYTPPSHVVTRVISTNSNVIPLSVKAPERYSTNFVSTNLYAANYGVRFRRGIFFRGLNHNHWSARYYHPRWRVWFWYCPSTLDWYYWNADKSSYLPINVIGSYPPEVGRVRGTTPPDGEAVPRISGGGQIPDVPNPEGIE